MELISKQKSDFLGIAISGLCVLHCALTPILFSISPLFGKAISKHPTLHGPWYWEVLDLVFLLSGLFAVYLSNHRKKNNKVKALLWITWIILAIGLMFEYLHISFGIYIMYLGSLGLIVAHSFSYWFTHQKPS